MLPKITLDIDEDEFLPKFLPLWNSENDIDFLWGGRDSGKSQFTIQRLLLLCLREKYFRCILVRKVFEDIKDSQWQGLKDQAEKWEIDKYFQFNSSPLQITCLLNGNKFIARGCDKPSKLKSISNPSHVWYEEGNQITEQDHITISTTIRSNRGKVKEIFTFNPECENDYAEFWLYKNFFQSHYENGEYSFTDIRKIKLPDCNVIELKYQSIHSTYRDNKFVTPERIARHEQLKEINPYYYQIFTLGLWGNRQTGGQFYKCYSQSKHIGKAVYDKLLPLHLTFDFNVNPYMSASVWQIQDEKKARKIDEIILPHPRNTSMAVCAEFERRFMSHNAGLFLYGDPGGLKQSTADETFVRVKEKDYNEFNKIKIQLSKFKPQLRVSRVYPPVKLRGDFINTIFEIKFEGIEILFGENCKHTHAEYANLKEASDGTKHKEKYKDETTGVTCEKWGHISDGDDYFLTEAFRHELIKYQTGDSNVHQISGGKSILSQNTY